MANLTPEQALEQARLAAKTAADAAAQAQTAVDQLATHVAHGTHAAAASVSAIDPFIFQFSVFVMAIFVGYYVVWSVTPALHTPLMSVTNAISSVIIVGALLAVGVDAVGAGAWPRAASASSRSCWLRSISLAASSSPIACSPCTRRSPEGRAGHVSQSHGARLSGFGRPLHHGVARSLEPGNSRQGNTYGIVGMVIAILTTLTLIPPSFSAYVLVLLALAIGGGFGAVTAKRIAMTQMPQLVAFFHSLVGLAAVFVAAAAINAPEAFGIAEGGSIRTEAIIEMSIGVAIGAITFTGSIIAFLKLDGRMSGKPILLPQRHLINMALAVCLVLFIGALVQTGNQSVFWLIVVVSMVFGVLIIVPIGGADMPVVVSMLNSYSGWAAAGIGFTLGNSALIITGALVGSSGAILSYIMCKGMNRSFISVILGGFGGETTAAGGGVKETRPVKQGSADDAAFIMKNAEKVIIVPGYGMAVAQAQHAVREMADKLKHAGVDVKYAIHPVAGRMRDT